MAAAAAAVVVVEGAAAMEVAVLEVAADWAVMAGWAAVG